MKIKTSHVCIICSHEFKTNNSTYRKTCSEECARIHRNTSGNVLLNKAFSNKRNEFYTQTNTIEKEMIHYKKRFKGKVILCNCDDPAISNFYKYFKDNFFKLGLKKLISTNYVDPQMNLFGKNNTKSAVCYQVVSTGPVLIGRPLYVHKTKLKGSGDFRSNECIEILKEADNCGDQSTIFIISRVCGTAYKI